MASAQVQKFSTNTWTKKTTKKKWPIIDNQSKVSNVKLKRDIVVIHKKAEHTYENVEYKKSEPNNTLKVSLDPDQKVPLKKSSSGRNYENPVIRNQAPLASSTPQKPPVGNSEQRKETKIPKLVKAKTCSIIESKCILKKSNSQPLGENLSKNCLPDKQDNKAKSLTNLLTTSSKENTKRTSASKIMELKTHFIETTNTKQDVEKKMQLNNNSANNLKVKEIVRRLNSLTELTPLPDNDICKKQTMSKAKSTLDLSSNKKLSLSKIPVNTVLRKNYPSIPCDLNKLDSDKSSAGITKHSSLNSKLAKSAHNLRAVSPPRLSLCKVDKSKTKSSLNLSSNQTRLSLHKSDNNLGKSMQNLNVLRQKPFQKSAQNLTKQIDVKIPKSFQNNKTLSSNRVAAQRRDFVNQTVNTHSNGPKIVKNLAQNFDEKPTATKEILKVHLKSDTSVRKEELSSKSITVRKEKLSASLVNNLNTKIDKNIKFKPQNDLPKPVIQIAEDFNKPCGKPKLLKTEPVKTPHVKEKDVKINKNNAENKSISKCNNEINPGKTDSNVKSRYAESKVGNAIKYFQENRQVSSLKNGLENNKKDFDYNSDNSDDSGNISNEIELDGDDTRLSSSSESLSTVLDVPVVGQDSGIDLSKSQQSPDTKQKIFFRDGVLTRLEAQRDERLVGTIVELQARCRGYLARKRLAQRKLQDLAVRCIQRNVRRFVAVRDWPWWRLLVRVTPLLNVHRTEEELRRKSEELEAIKVKLEKVESDRTKLKYENDKLEAKLSEMTADLAEEHSTSTLATERLDAETSERLKLEKELNEVQQKNKELQNSSERLEMELLYARSDLNGIQEEDEDGDGNDGVYKQRFERAIKELEFTKRRLQQQHEDDLEQLVGLKKQLEKKLADAYEEVEEQRQVVGQWKRKVQKLNGEMNDLRHLLEEQNARNNLLEKKQRKFDTETQMLQDELKKERQTKERFSREKEVCIAEKYAIETNLADTRLELELKEEKLAALQREYDEVTCGGRTEEEVIVLRRQKIDLDRRLQDQEEELDELSGQVQLLEQAKLRLEMTLESMRKEAKKESQLRDDEVEDIRCNAQKKLKALEQQLENEHEERTLLLREKHELERRLTAAAESERNERAGDEALLQRLKRDLKRTKALLRDTQAQLERQKAETPGKATIRQLKNQLEDLECARAVAVKAKQSLETELLETQSTLDEAYRQRQEAEERANMLLREKGDLQTQLEENEEELAEVLKKFKGTVQQMSLDQLALQEQVSLVSELEIERNQLKEQLAEVTSRLESVESMGDPSSNLLVKRSELKVKELESKLELEQTTRSRLEVQITRLKEAIEKSQNDITSCRVKEQQSQDQIRKLQRQLREVKEELNKSLVKESEVIIKKKDIEKRYEALEVECSTARADLKLAVKRIEDLQSAIQGELEDSISDNSESEPDTYSSDDSVNTFLSNSKSRSPKLEKTSISSADIRRLSNATKSSTSNSIGKDVSYT